MAYNKAAYEKRKAAAQYQKSLDAAREKHIPQEAVDIPVITENQKPNNMTTTDTAGAVKKKHLNEGLGLEQFDYSNGLRGEEYEKYLQIVEGKVIDPNDPKQRRAGGINAHKKYVFEVYNVTPKKVRLFPRSLTDLTMIEDGFELKISKPVSITTTFLKDALALNTSLYSAIGGYNNNPIFYYLLQIPKK